MALSLSDRSHALILVLLIQRPNYFSFRPGEKWHPRQYPRGTRITTHVSCAGWTRHDASCAIVWLGPAGEGDENGSHMGPRVVHVHVMLPHSQSIAVQGTIRLPLEHGNVDSHLGVVKKHIDANLLIPAEPGLGPAQISSNIWTSLLGQCVFLSVNWAWPTNCQFRPDLPNRKVDSVPKTWFGYSSIIFIYKIKFNFVIKFKLKFLAAAAPIILLPGSYPKRSSHLLHFTSCSSSSLLPPPRSHIHPLMADMVHELPTFSLGLDSDCDSPPASPNLQRHDRAIGDGGEDEDFRSVDDPPRTLRRLQRGFRPRSACPSPTAKVDDDIEEFSSDEEMGTGTASQQGSCSRLFQTSIANSPIRRFVLVDSDSDDPSVQEEANNPGMSSKRKIEASFDKPGDEDFWKDFHQMKSSRISTPTFDEFCTEYFHSVKDNKNKMQKPETYSSPGDNLSCLRPSSSRENGQTPLPPSHQYFFHYDLRIQNLVRSRLPYFFPLGGGNNRECEQSSTSVIDYMSQFNSGEPSQKLGKQKVSTKKGSRAKGKSGASNTKEPVCVDNWVNPRSSVTIPMNAGKRRVCANGKSASHWYTGQDGRKVYITGNGQELTGSAAYRHYRKESGGGSRKSRKKPKANKKAKR
ncbi:hypothetical protein CRG98_023733 [Punica granatum]|uniref:Uncharacterized protein n=1 Tax=Punica granatum TaxID=22663 RepID=A0A2I0JHY5_PUNGR|nr:hypothetical protein CRG98_023733 [Punica granatum]